MVRSIFRFFRIQPYIYIYAVNNFNNNNLRDDDDLTIVLYLIKKKTLEFTNKREISQTYTVIIHGEGKYSVTSVHACIHTFFFESSVKVTYHKGIKYACMRQRP